MSRSRNPAAADWVGGDLFTAESWEAEWMPFPSQSPQYLDFPFCQIQPEEMVMVVSLQPNFPGQLPLVAPDGQLVFPVDSFPARLGTPESWSYLGSVDLPPGDVVRGAGEDDQKQGWSRGNWNNRTQEVGSGPKGRETWSRRETRRGGDGKEEATSRREPRTFGKWMAASKREKKVSKKKRKCKVKPTEDVKMPTEPMSCDVEILTKEDVQIEGAGASQDGDTPKMENQFDENENTELLAASLKTLKLDWHELE